LTDFLLFFVILTAIFMSGFFSGMETGIYCIDRLRLDLDGHRNDAASLRLQRVLRDEGAAITLTLAGTSVFNYIATTSASYLVALHLGNEATRVELYTTAIITPVLFVFAEAAPKTLFQEHADLFMRRGSRLLVLFDRLFRVTGIVALLTRMSNGVTRLIHGTGDARGPLEPRHRMASMLREALIGSNAEMGLSDLVDRVLRLSETPVHRVMVPARQVLAINHDADRQTLVKFARTTQFSRMPVYDVATQRILGVIVIDELLDAQNWRRVGEKIQPTIQLPAFESVSSAILKAQTSRHAMMIVVDRKQRMIGLVTLKDLLEEIVGELPQW